MWIKNLMRINNFPRAQATVFLLHLWWRTGEWRYVFDDTLLALCRCLPLSLRSGVPPWNNDGCKMDVASQLATINPLPKAGRKHAWHAHDKQVSSIRVVVWQVINRFRMPQACGAWWWSLKSRGGGRRLMVLGLSFFVLRCKGVH